MTKLTEQMYSIFDRDEFSFKKIKEKYTPEEIDQIKAEFKEVWLKWKEVQLNVNTELLDNEFAKVHVESWTNGWNLRDHYWASYRLKSMSDQSPCIGVMLDRKQLQVYLMFQHYNSEKRKDTPEKYNKLLREIPTWSKSINIRTLYLWDKNEMEFVDHLSLNEYLQDKDKQNKFNQEACKSSFLLGKFAFRGKDEVENMEKFILSGIKDLLPLYSKLAA